MREATQPWLDPEWVEVVLGVDHLSAEVRAVFDAYAWAAEPVPGAPSTAPDDVVDFLLGLDLVARQLGPLFDRCAEAGAMPVVVAPPPEGDLLR